jgi:hypothetical protein
MSELKHFSEYAGRIRQFIAGHSVARDESAPAEAARFNELALTLFRLQYARNEAYRRWCGSLAVAPGAVVDWRHIPAMPAVAFKELELTTLAPEQRSTVFCSSGTTGQKPSRHFHDAESLKLYEASLLPWFQAHFLGSSPKATSALRLLFLTPPPALAPQSSLAHMFGTIAREWSAGQAAFAGAVDREGAWSLDAGAVLVLLERAVKDGEAIGLLGTAFNFVHLLDELGRRNIRLDLPRGSRVLETGGYKGRSRAVPKAELHRLITARLGIPQILCEYGMCELSSQAYDRRLGAGPGRAEDRVFRFPPWARARIISPETGREVEEGQPGLVRVYDLANLRSVLAVQTEDLGVRRGFGFTLLGRAAHAEPRGCSLRAP